QSRVHPLVDHVQPTTTPPSVSASPCYSEGTGLRVGRSRIRSRSVPAVPQKPEPLLHLERDGRQDGADVQQQQLPSQINNGRELCLCGFGTWKLGVCCCEHPGGASMDDLSLGNGGRGRDREGSSVSSSRDQRVKCEDIAKRPSCTGEFA